jgi:hypothetical protein
LSSNRRLEINADGYIAAGEFDAALAELDRASQAYGTIRAQGMAATLEDTVASRTAMLAAREPIKELPKYADCEDDFEIMVKKLERKLRNHDRDTDERGVKAAKSGSLADLRERGQNLETSAAAALNVRCRRTC